MDSKIHTTDIQACKFSHPQLSNKWHMDELFVKMKGGETRKGHTGIAYLWNVVDRESRFLIASKLSEKEILMEQCKPAMK